jgi:hypothetical protein
LAVDALGLAVARAFTELLRLAAVPDLDAVLPAGLGAVLDLAAVLPAGRDAVLDRDEPPLAGRDAVLDRDELPLAGRDAVLDRDAPPLAGRDTAGRTDDMVLAAAVSDLAAVVIALVAVFIACMAVDIVLAEDVALVAAAVIFEAAEVTFVAADETVRAAAAVDGAFADDTARVDLDLVVLVLVVLAVPLGRLAARAGVLLLVDLVRALAELRRAVVRVVVRAGTDLPPSRSITEVLFHEQRRFTRRWRFYLENNGHKQTKIAATFRAGPRHAGAWKARGTPPVTSRGGTLMKAQGPTGPGGARPAPTTGTRRQRRTHRPPQGRLRRRP